MENIPFVNPTSLDNNDLIKFLYLPNSLNQNNLNQLDMSDALSTEITVLSSDSN